MRAIVAKDDLKHDKYNLIKLRVSLALVELSKISVEGRLKFRGNK